MHNHVCFKHNSEITPVRHYKEIKKAISVLAKEINNDFVSEKYVNLVPLLTGSMIFAADLIRELECLSSGKWIVNPVITTAYGSGYNESVPEMTSSSDFSDKIKHNCKSIILDDLADTGQTLELVQKNISSIIKNEVLIAVLVDKKVFRTVNVPIKYRCFDYDGSDWLVGFGMDAEGFYRGAGCIGSIPVPKLVT